MGQVDPEGVDQGFDQAEQAGIGRAYVAQATGEEGVGNCHLEDAEGSELEGLRRGTRTGQGAGREQHPAAECESASQVIDNAQPGRVEVSKPSQADHDAGVGDAADQGQDDAESFLGA